MIDSPHPTCGVFGSGVCVWLPTSDHIGLEIVGKPEGVVLYRDRVGLGTTVSPSRLVMNLNRCHRKLGVPHAVQNNRIGNLPQIPLSFYIDVSLLSLYTLGQLLYITFILEVLLNIRFILETVGSVGWGPTYTKWSQGGRTHN